MTALSLLKISGVWNTQPRKNTGVNCKHPALYLYFYLL
ncbi:hypothetical protein M595_1599 [Lyngbya aestuarii BL J]|uniref:Uncharacterized protein n=1 Tax=Lyngbya aestuarii BL J TaxID=1348334 RepID=U7QMM5_9CYAN|nr:hypothetical protein M595_1599 [Lyngbya aestuarii BL J]